MYYLYTVYLHTMKCQASCNFLFLDDPFYIWLMEKKDIFEDEDLFDLTLDCLRYYPKDRLDKESLIENKFFHPTENHEPSPLIRLQPNIRPLQEAVSDAIQSRRSNIKQAVFSILF